MNTRTPHTKTGRTAHTVVAKVDGPSRLKEEIEVPGGTHVIFIGRWVVENLNWLAPNKGRNSIVYNDADHYGITIREEDVEDIQEVRQ